MSVEELIIKIRLRINKLDSQDYENIPIWQILETYNRAQLLFARKNLHGGNIYREGDEKSKRRIDDFNKLLKEVSIPLIQKDRYVVISKPQDYMLFKRVSIKACKGECVDDNFTVYLAEEANVDILLGNRLYAPSFSWRETFCTITEEGIKVYHNNDFDIEDAKLIYYRYPLMVQKAGQFALHLKGNAPNDVDPEFTEDTLENIIDFTAQMLSSDIESIQQFQLRDKLTNENN